MRYQLTHELAPGIFTLLFPTSFDVAASAVQRYLEDSCNGGMPIPPMKDTSGLLRIRLASPDWDNIGAIFTVQTGDANDRLTSLDMQIVQPSDHTSDEYMALQNNPVSILLPLYRLFAACGQSITQRIRLTCEDYGRKIIPMLTPPPPIPHSEVEWHRFCIWRDIHAPYVDWSEIAKHTHDITAKTLQNRYSEYTNFKREIGLLPPKDRPPRGKK